MAPRPLQRGVEPAWRGRHYRDAMRRLSWSTIGNALEAPTMTSMITVDQEKGGTAQTLPISRQATSRWLLARS